MRNNALPIIAMIAAAGVVLLLVFWGSATSLRSSAIGTDGLRIWLNEQGVEVVQANRRIERQRDDFSLRILPLYDVNLKTSARQPQSELEFLLQRSQQDIDDWAVADKLRALPTLVLLPKWTSGMYVRRLAYPRFLIDTTYLVGVLDQMGFHKLRMQYLTDGMVQASVRFIDGNQADVSLYHPRVFNRNSLSRDCRPALESDIGILMIRCKLSREHPATFILSDPDLLNNHGLALGQNAEFAKQLVAVLRDGDTRPVYLDTVRRVMLRDGSEKEVPQHDRTTDDLLRFFEQPFLTFWIFAMITLIMLFWRGLVRFGPIRSGAMSRPDASKLAAIDAKARLLRLSGNDHRLVAEYVRNRVHVLATSVLGPFATGDLAAQLQKVITRRDKTVARDFARSVQSVTDCPPRTPSQELFKKLSEFDLQYKRVSDATGRISKHH